MNNYEILSQIGKGNFGTITKIIRKSDKKILVWKEINYKEMTEKEKQQLVSEVNILRELKHQNIVRYYDRIIDKKQSKIYIIMEYCEGGDLSQLIKRLKKKNEKIPEEVIWKILSQVILAVNYIHTFKSGKILHRDIKPSNIFLDKDNNVKLGDFGLSRELSEESIFAYSHVGTPYYMSPEQIEESKYNEKSDIWSLGCFLYELLTFHPPFQAKNHIQLAKKITNCELEKIDSYYSEELWRIITWMLKVNYNERPNSEELLGIPNVSVRIKERKIKDYYSKIKEFEENLKKKEKELVDRENTVSLREQLVLEKENKVKNKEIELCEKEKNLNEIGKKIKSGSFSTNYSNNMLSSNISDNNNNINNNNINNCFGGDGNGNNGSYRGSNENLNNVPLSSNYIKRNSKNCDYKYYSNTYHENNNYDDFSPIDTNNNINKSISSNKMVDNYTECNLNNNINNKINNINNKNNNINNKNNNINIMNNNINNNNENFNNHININNNSNNIHFPTNYSTPKNNNYNNTLSGNNSPNYINYSSNLTSQSIHHLATNSNTSIKQTLENEYSNSPNFNLNYLKTKNSFDFNSIKSNRKNNYSRIPKSQSSFKFDPSLYESNDIYLTPSNTNRQFIEKKNLKRTNTPKITSISNRYYNITPNKTFSNKINNNNSIVSSYYSKFIKRTNSGVSINKMIEKNRNFSAGKNSYKKFSYIQK